MYSTKQYVYKASKEHKCKYGIGRHKDIIQLLKRKKEILRQAENRTESYKVKKQYKQL